MFSLHALRLFQRSSRTYFFSSLFFPGAVRDDITILYAFVRTADDFVDQTPQDATGFAAFRAEWQRAFHQNHTESVSAVVSNFVALARRAQFEPEWVESFLDAMQSDLEFQPYRTIADLETYMRGSAEVIGYMIARILQLPNEAFPSAALLGKSMQYINFLRDIRIDLELQRVYIPLSVRRTYGLETWNMQTLRRHPKKLTALLRAEVKRYEAWQHQAATGYRFIPWRSRVAIMAAADMYAWTAHKIAEQPLSVLDTVHKPSIARVLFSGFRKILAV